LHRRAGRKRRRGYRAGQRQIAAELGVDETTVRRDLTTANAALTPKEAAANAALDIPLVQRVEYFDQAGPHHRVFAGTYMDASG